MAKCESVTIRVARGGYIVDAQYPYEPSNGSGVPESPSRNLPTVAGSLRDALEKAANLLGGSISVTEEAPTALDNEPSELFGRGGNVSNLY
jgi:hypothetical protein